MTSLPSGVETRISRFQASYVRFRFCATVCPGTAFGLGIRVMFPAASVRREVSEPSTLTISFAALWVRV
ncbi:MAG: hypothetical protein IJQ31_16460 [Thermoguttaceae bacterium]|nr:hypothetical protein [Thermoguttaceae bacterium]